MCQNCLSKSFFIMASLPIVTPGRVFRVTPEKPFKLPMDQLESDNFRIIKVYFQPINSEDPTATLILKTKTDDGTVERKEKARVAFYDGISTPQTQDINVFVPKADEATLVVKGGCNVLVKTTFPPVGDEENP